MPGGIARHGTSLVALVDLLALDGHRCWEHQWEPPERLRRDPFDHSQGSSQPRRLGSRPLGGRRPDQGRIDSLSGTQPMSRRASTGSLGGAARIARRSPQRGPARSLRRTDPVDSQMIRIRSICRYVASDSWKSCGSMVRSNDGPDTGRAPDPRGLAGDEAEQVEDIGQSDPGSDFGEVNARHDCAHGRRDYFCICACKSACSREWRWSREEEPVILLVVMIIYLESVVRRGVVLQR